MCTLWLAQRERGARGRDCGKDLAGTRLACASVACSATDGVHALLLGLHGVHLGFSGFWLQGFPSPAW